jgi:iron complex outermembrane receptor protein
MAIAGLPTVLLGAQLPAPGESGGGLSAVVVTATRIAEDSRDLPVSIDRIDANTIRSGRQQVNLSESLATVPGVSAQNRQNYAQDLQLSIRGFGARSSFGVRGVRLYSDGIPGTMPMARASSRNLTSGRPITSRCCAAPSRRCTAIPRAA